MDPTKKYNYIEVVNRMIPEFYRDIDYMAHGSEEDVSITFLGKILKAAVQSSMYFSSITDLTGGTYDNSTLAPFFNPKNRRTRISSNTFANDILGVYNLTFDSFNTKQDLYDWFEGTFLPDATLNNPAGLFVQMSGIGFGEFSTEASVHNYLIEKMGMFYFLNNSDLDSTVVGSAASSIMVSAILEPILKGEDATEQDSINALFTYFWKNREASVNTNHSYFASFIPRMYASGSSEIADVTYASGTQLLNSVKLHLGTWTDPRLKDYEFLGDSLDILLGGGEYPVKMRDAGAFQRFLKAISLGIADISLILEEISDLLSIDECPERFLELLGNNIGWIFLTGEYDKWRAQLKNAVLVYKTKGSQVGLEAAFKLMFPEGMFSVSDIAETWECYVPKLVYYLIKTESFIAQNSYWSKNIDDVFSGTKPDVKFNQVPLNYPESEDRTADS